jgi:iron(III) transport system substrate-binding protein
MEGSDMRRVIVVLFAAAVMFASGGLAFAQAPIEDELVLITPVSKFVFDAALKAFAQYAREKWNVSVKTNAIPAGPPGAYGRSVAWKGTPEAAIFGGGEPALFEKLQDPWSWSPTGSSITRGSSSGLACRT